MNACLHVQGLSRPYQRLRQHFVIIFICIKKCDTCRAFQPRAYLYPVQLETGTGLILSVNVCPPRISSLQVAFMTRRKPCDRYGKINQHTKSHLFRCWFSLWEHTTDEASPFPTCRASAPPSLQTVPRLVIDENWPGERGKWSTKQAPQKTCNGNWHGVFLIGCTI